MIGILGAGLSGLFLGSLLKNAKKDFKILEKTDTPGGLCRSTREDGFVFDNTGGHIIYSKDNDVLDKIKDILKDNITKKKRNIKILYNGRYVKYPFENSLSDLDKQDNFECLMGFLETINREQKKPTNFEEWIYETFGRGIAEKYLIPYNKKIWKTDMKSIDTFWVEDRIPKPPPEDIIKSSLGIETEGYVHQLFFYYPETGGIQTLINILTNRVKENIVKNFNVKKIKKQGDKWIISDGKNEEKFDKIVSTIPIQELITSMDAPSEVIKSTNNLKYNSMMTVMLGIRGIEIPPYHGIYIPDPEIIANRIVLLNNMSDKVSPNGTKSIMAEISYKENDDNSIMTDEDIIKTVESYITKMFGNFKILFSKVVRNKYAYIIYDLDYQKNMKIIEKFLNEEKIKVCGRFGEFKYLNMDQCIQNALRISEEL